MAKKVKIACEYTKNEIGPGTRWSKLDTISVERTVPAIAKCLINICRDSDGADPLTVAQLLIRFGRIRVDGKSISYRLTFI